MSQFRVIEVEVIDPDGLGQVSRTLGRRRLGFRAASGATPAVGSLGRGASG
jgi:hypothetical protein